MKGPPAHWTTLKKLIYLKAARGSSPSWVWQLLTGTAPLTLLDAVAHPLHSLTQYGLCVQDGTPTPDAPVDIVCNNGVLKFGKPLTLDPTRYYAYISTSNTWSYSTDSYSIVMPVTVGKKYKITADPTTPIDGGVVNAILRWGFVDTVYDDWKLSAVATSFTSVTIYDWVRSTPQDTQSVEVTATRPFMVIQMGAAAFASNLANGRIGVAVQEVYTDGEGEVLTVSGENLYNKTDGVISGYPSATGTWNARSGESSELSIIVTLEEGKTYTAQRANGANCPFRVMGSANRPLTNGQSLQVISAPSATTYNEATFTVPSGYPHIVFYVRNNAGSTLTIDDVVNAFQVELGSIATAYEPYVTPQTISGIPMLLGVGDYKDEVEIISGLLTHKIGIKVLNGTEDWLYSSGWSDTTHKCFYVELDTIKQQTTVTNECLCSHLEWYSRDSFYADKTIVGGCVSGYIPTDPKSGRALTVRVSSSIAETANDFKAWLAAQYAAGTPVIVVYPLATETTEQTTPHALHTSAGTNVVDVTAEVSPVQLSVEYAKEAG